MFKEKCHLAASNIVLSEISTNVQKMGQKSQFTTPFGVIHIIKIAWDDETKDKPLFQY